MSGRPYLAAVLLSLGLAAVPALAAAEPVEELVVTASRLSEYDPAQTPSVVLPKRADNLITKVTVICDTRDLSQRKEELKATLRNLIKAAAQDKLIDLGVGEEVVGAFDETMLDQVIAPDRKADTNRAEILVKTAVRPGDTFDAATGRIKAFVERATKVGRTEVLLDDEWELSLVAPQQYRPQIVQRVAEDAAKVSAAFGAGYGVEVQGLQLPVAWYQAGKLDLALYIPYKLTVRPVQP
jgi:hypothetical protein